MKRPFTVAVACFLAHLVDEALTGMHDDPIIAAAYAPLAHLGPRHAAYLVFQATLALGLLAVVLWAHGGRARDVVVAVIAVSLLAESHHAIRALYTFSWNSGLFTSLPLPVAGAALLRRLVHERRNPACSSTSSSPWESVESFSASRRSSPRGRRRACSASPPATTTRPAA